MALSSASSASFQTEAVNVWSLSARQLNGLKGPAFSRLLPSRDLPNTNPPKQDGIFVPIWNLRGDPKHDWGKGNLRNLMETIVFVFLMDMQRVQVPPLTLSDYAPAPYSVFSSILKETTYIEPEMFIEDIARQIPLVQADELRRRFEAYKREHADQIRAARQRFETRTYEHDQSVHSYPLSDEAAATSLLNGLFDLTWDVVRRLDDTAPLRRSISAFAARRDNNNPELGSIRQHLLALVLKEQGMQTDWRAGWASDRWGPYRNSADVDWTAAFQVYHEQIDRHLFVQWAFDRQLCKVLDLAELLGITLADDEPYPIPKADAWLRPDVIYEDGEAGVNVDQFSPLGQRWQGFVLAWRKKREAVIRYWKERFLNGLGRVSSSDADASGYERAKQMESQSVRSWIEESIRHTGQVDMDALCVYASNTMDRLRLSYGIPERQGIMMRRKDHAYGAYRSYVFTPSMKTGLWPRISDLVTEGREHPEDRPRLAREIMILIKDTIREFPAFQEHLDSLFDEDGNLRMSAMIQVARPAEGDPLPKKWWYRLDSVYKRVHTEGPTVWDCAAISDPDPIWRSALKEEPLDRLIGYLWPEDPRIGPGPHDELLIGFYDYNGGKFNDVEEALIELLREVAERGATMVLELLGNPYVPAQQSVEQMEVIAHGTKHHPLQIIPMIYALDPPSDYALDQHTRQSQLAGGLQDSATLLQVLMDRARLGTLEATSSPWMKGAKPSGLYLDPLKEIMAQFLLHWVYRSPAQETMVGFFDYAMATDNEGRPNNPDSNVPHPNWQIRMALDRRLSELLLASLGYTTGVWAEEMVAIIRHLQEASGRLAFLDGRPTAFQRRQALQTLQALMRQADSPTALQEVLTNEFALSGMHIGAYRWGPLGSLVMDAVFLLGSYRQVPVLDTSEWVTLTKTCVGQWTHWLSIGHHLRHLIPASLNGHHLFWAYHSSLMTEYTETRPWMIEELIRANLCHLDVPSWGFIEGSAFLKLMRSLFVRIEKHFGSAVAAEFRELPAIRHRFSLPSGA